MRETIELLSVEPVSRVATISFRSPQGDETLIISEYTFNALFDKWDTSKLGEMTDQQKRFLGIAKKALDNPKEWFKQKVNELERIRASLPTQKEIE